MKKVLSLALVLILFLSLAACGRPDAETKAKLELFDKYADLIEALEVQDEKAVAEAFMSHWDAADTPDDTSEENTEPEWPSGEEEQMLFQYSEIFWHLDAYTKSGRLSSSEQVGDDWVEYSTQETLGRYYELLQNMSAIDKWLKTDLSEHYGNAFDGLEKDREAVLARFTVLPEQLLKITQETKDNMGNVQTEDILECQYDAEGRPADLDTMDNTNLFVSFWTFNSKSCISYTSDGQIEKVTIGTENNIEGIFTPAYDEKGNMISCHVKTTYGELDNTYTYNEKNLLTTADICDGFKGTSKYTCIYDEQGHLLEEAILNSPSDWKNIYSYDGNGCLVSVQHLYLNNLGDVNADIIQTYTYDDQGRIQSVHIVPGEADSNSRFIEKNQTYVYGPTYSYAGK